MCLFQDYMTDYDENEIETKMKMKNSSHSYMISPAPRHENKHTKYKMCHNTVMVKCISSNT